jgi:hypothetical protein
MLTLDLSTPASRAARVEASDWILTKPLPSQKSFSQVSAFYIHFRRVNTPSKTSEEVSISHVKR